MRIVSADVEVFILYIVMELSLLSRSTNIVLLCETGRRRSEAKVVSGSISVGQFSFLNICFRGTLISETGRFVNFQFRPL